MTQHQSDRHTHIRFSPNGPVTLVIYQQGWKPGGTQEGGGEQYTLELYRGGDGAPARAISGNGYFISNVLQQLGIGYDQFRVGTFTPFLVAAAGERVADMVRTYGELTGGDTIPFSAREAEALLGLKREKQPDIDARRARTSVDRHLDFARWLVEHGRVSDD